MVLVRDFPGHSDLVFGCDLSHDFSSRALSPYYSKDQILTQPHHVAAFSKNQRIVKELSRMNAVKPGLRS